jgi:LysM repeat protein
MHRATLLTTVAVLVVASAGACGSGDDSALETLPPILTTTSTSTTTTLADSRRIFYVVKAGDNLSDIAKRYQVTRQSIVDLNQLPNNGEVIQIGQELEIPNDVRIDETLPPLPETTGAP